jgi:YHS domain-containing protein
VAWLLRLILLLLILRALWRLVSGIVEGAMARPAQLRDAERPPVPLVRDPVCGTYVVRGAAVTAASGGEVHYFCSEHCRRSYDKRDEMWNAERGMADAGHSE